MKRQIGFVGIGKIGKGMVKRLLDHGYEVVVYDIFPEAVDAVKAQGAIGVSSLEELINSLQPQRIIWLMVPAGNPVDKIINELINIGPYVDDIIIDGGNSNYHDTIRRATALQARGVLYLDVGTSGGMHGAEVGFSLTVGGQMSAYEIIKPILESLAGPERYAYVGPSGSGHFVKMVHNAIEYGIMQAMGEGFELLANGPYESLDLKNVAHVWNHGSIIRSFLMELAERAFEKDPRLIKVADYAEDTGEGRWALQEAINFNIPFDTIAHALFARMRSRQDESFAIKVVSALRHEFGGHEIKRKI